MNLISSTTPIPSNLWDRSPLLLTNPFWLLVQSLTHQALFLIDRTGMILTWNSGAESLLGYPPEEIIGQNFSILYQLKDQANHQFDLDFQLALQRGKFETVTHRIKKNGSAFATHLVLTALYENETHIGFSVSMIPLSDAQQTQVRLHASERRLQAFFDTPNAGMADASIDGRILRVNDAFCHMLGYSREELLCLTVPDILFPEEREEVLAQYNRVGQGISGSYHSERRYRRKDGSVLWAHVNVAEVRDEAGNPSEISAVVIDLTARKQAEFELERQRTELQLILDTVPAWIFFKNREHRIIRVNAEVIRSSGFSLSELEGKTDEELGLPEAARYREDEEEIFTTGKPKRGIIETVRTRNGTRWLQTEKLPLYDSQGQIVGIIGFSIDLTERRKLEEQFHQSQKMEAVGRLAGGIAHDFNNLLTIISGFSELLLLELKNDDPHRTSVSAIRDASQRAAALTRQLLLFSRKQVVEQIPFDLNEIVLNCEKLLQRLIGEDIVLTSTLAENLRLIEADSNQIEQVIMNLVVNARDAMPQGGRITIETKNVDISEDQMFGYLDLKLGRYVQLAVSDTGHGMTEEIKSQIFEPFFTTKEVGKGTGLGLSVVHGIVKQLEGYIYVYSEPNMGTSFKILLPAVASSMGRSSSTTLPLPQQGTETILLVEDDDAVRQIARIALETHGYQVLEVRQGLEAIDRISQRTEKIDLLLTDVVMPEMGGKELVELIRPYHPLLKVLFMSGYTDDAIVRHGIIEGTDAFIQKPFSPLGLAKKVRAVLDEEGR